MGNKMVRTATFKDSGKTYLVRLINADTMLLRLWGEVTSATARVRRHGPDLCGVPMADVVIEERVNSVSLHNLLVDQGAKARMAALAKTYGMPVPAGSLASIGSAPADLVALVNKAVGAGA